MADYNGAQQTLIAAGGLAERGCYAGNVLSFVDTYEFAGIAATKTVALCGTLPAGLRVLQVIATFDDMGTSVTFDIGDSDNIDRYFDALDVATAAGVTSDVLVDGVGYVIGTADGDDQLLVTVNAAAATGTLKVVVLGSM